MSTSAPTPSAMTNIVDEGGFLMIDGIPLARFYRDELVSLHVYTIESSDYSDYSDMLDELAIDAHAMCFRIERYGPLAQIYRPILSALCDVFDRPNERESLSSISNIAPFFAPLVIEAIDAGYRKIRTVRCDCVLYDRNHRLYLQDEHGSTAPLSIVLSEIDEFGHNSPGAASLSPSFMLRLQHLRDIVTKHETACHIRDVACIINPPVLADIERNHRKYIADRNRLQASLVAN